MDYDENQLSLPPSFHALYLDERQRPTAPMGAVQGRYELCEDLAQHLTGQALALQPDGFADQQALLQRFHATLAVPEAGLLQVEARWVVRRLAELLNWPREAADETTA